MQFSFTSFLFSCNEAFTFYPIKCDTNVGEWLSFPFLTLYVKYFLNADHTLPEPKKEESNDWPHGLLNIGTFGDSKLPENTESETFQDDDQPLDHDLAEFTPEEVSKLEKELTKLLSKKPAPKVDGEIANLPLDRFMNCPSSLEVDRRISTSLCSDLDDKDDEDDINRTIRVILGRCRDACMETKKKSIGKKSISFLLKKMFVCRSGFDFTPNLRDTPQESRMEKVIVDVLLLICSFDL